ncbi:hypothetical protein FAES_4395 [Fibrella aestuarina BUZ 2]|uniref:Carboxymuconolactone decarboxylase-like domain-containing protein n=1 Tax=Fibrella aestuarina BUZ 2 TaxID=1166018 RepID=I0KE41_9BACT|nr:hypothetical protein [Fibrella aestuarina]CCH02394.1 hypothetical protein FAES_4395 [Fibrella aestuarina BUZ 2]
MMKYAFPFRLVQYEEATPEVQQLYDETRQALGLPFVLNWFKCQGNNPVLLRGNWTKLRATLLLGVVPNIIKQLIIYNVSTQRGCHYCATVHGLFANRLGNVFGEQFRVTDEMNSELIPLSYRTAVRVVTKAALQPKAITEDHFSQLTAVGFNGQEIQELMAQADLVNMLNTIADISGIRIDNELVEIAA